MDILLYSGLLASNHFKAFTVQLQIFVAQNFHEMLKFAKNINFHGKIFVIAAIRAVGANSLMNFREKYFRELRANHEIHENIIPRKFGAIRYYLFRSYIAVHGPL